MTEMARDDGHFMDPGRKIGPVPAPHPITGRPRTIEESRLANDPRVLARKEGWEQGQFLGDPVFRKDGRYIIVYFERGTFMSGDVFSDAHRQVNVMSWPSEVRRALRGERCTCGPLNIDGHTYVHRSRHEDSCALGRPE